MERILLLIDHKENRSLLANWLGQAYTVVFPDEGSPDDPRFDLGILDLPALERTRNWLETRKRAEEPVLLPLLLTASRREVPLAAQRLRAGMDELIVAPIEKAELQTRIEILLRARRLSLELKRQNDDMRAFVHALTHDVRAPLRSISGFAQILADEHDGGLSEEGGHCLARIRSAAEELQELIKALLGFMRLGRDEVMLRPVELAPLMDEVVRSMRDDLQAQDAHISVPTDTPPVIADAGLLRVVLTNLLANAIKYVRPGIRPEVHITVARAGDRCRIDVIDNGIGVPEADRQRIFEPFVRLHGVEEFPGVGLGLPTVRKAVDRMGGQLGVDSAPGGGSRFWVELDGTPLS